MLYHAISPLLTPDEGPSLETPIFPLSFQVVREPLPFVYHTIPYHTTPHHTIPYHTLDILKSYHIQVGQWYDTFQFLPLFSIHHSF